MPTLQKRLAVGHATLRKLRPLATLCERFRAYAIALITFNLITLNLITLNLITFNLITFNLITFNQLTFNQLTFNQLTQKNSRRNTFHG
ncbi:MAG: hypothetical protein F6K26_17110 [Moorea sp. SIO2I5]|nr:hypothetical protein [Moorena sp. SIO2I5]